MIETFSSGKLNMMYYDNPLLQAKQLLLPAPCQYHKVSSLVQGRLLRMPEAAFYVFNIVTCFPRNHPFARDEIIHGTCLVKSS